MPGEKRTHHRNPVEAQIACSLLTTRDDKEQTACVVRNYSPTGVYIESGHRFKKGAVLFVRMTAACSPTSEQQREGEMRSVSLAEVRWVQPLAPDDIRGFGIGLKYLA